MSNIISIRSLAIQYGYDESTIPSHGYQKGGDAANLLI